LPAPPVLTAPTQAKCQGPGLEERPPGRGRGTSVSSAGGREQGDSLSVDRGQAISSAEGVLSSEVRERDVPSVLLAEVANHVGEDAVQMARGREGEVQMSRVPEEGVLVSEVREEDALMARLTSTCLPSPSLPDPGDFFHSLELAATPRGAKGAVNLGETNPIRDDLGDGAREDLSFFESIGLYWVNPADRLSEQKPEQVDEMGDLLEELGIPETRELETGVAPGRRWRLWQPDGVEDLVEELLPQLYLPGTETTDPTVMEDRRLARPDHHCSPCRRSFASSDLHQRHLLTELHAKHAQPDSSSQTKRTAKKTKFFDDETPTPTNTTAPLLPAPLASPPAPRGTCSPVEAHQCPCCGAGVAPRQLGKHLVSHFHYHRSLGHPGAHQLVLDNIGAIVHQSPFQCHPCNFYCNWHGDLVSHVALHDGDGVFHCQLCQVTVHHHGALEEHLASPGHMELVMVVNRSVPVVLRRLHLLPCTQCPATFRYNFTLRRHMLHHHGCLDFTLPDHHTYSCTLCTFTTLKESSLKAHQFLVHPSPKLKYDCRLCARQFPSREAAARHRSTASHRDTVALRRGQVGTERTCQHCGQMFPCLSELEEHLGSEHDGVLPQCHLCGHLFHHPQQLPPHLRAACGTDSSLGICKSGRFTCSLCTFTSNQETILSLHIQYIHSHRGEEAQVIGKCPLCDKVVPSKRLKSHLKTHNSDKFHCKLCNISSESELEYTNHLASVHADAEVYLCTQCPYRNTKKSLLNLHTKRQHRMTKEKRKCHICDSCDATFKLKSSLVKHSQTNHCSSLQYNFFCTEVGCNFKASFKSDLDRHVLKHIDSKQLSCSKCDFMCKRRSDLNRHYRLTHEDLPYINCDMCDYKTKNNTHMKRHSKTHQELTSFEIHVDENDLLIGSNQIVKHEVMLNG